jgi:hypothetical protein
MWLMSALRPFTAMLIFSRKLPESRYSSLTVFTGCYWRRAFQVRTLFTDAPSSSSFLRMPTPMSKGRGAALAPSLPFLGWCCSDWRAKTIDKEASDPGGLKCLDRSHVSLQTIMRRSSVSPSEVRLDFGSSVPRQRRPSYSPHSLRGVSTKAASQRQTEITPAGSARGPQKTRRLAGSPSAWQGLWLLFGICPDVAGGVVLRAARTPGTA